MSYFDYKNQTTEREPLLHKIGSWLGGVWRDFTGQTAVEQQYQNEINLMNLQNSINRQNLVDSADLQKQGLLKAGLNTALAYGGSVGGNSVGSVSGMHAPLPMSGSEKLDRLLSTIQGVQGLMQNQYQIEASKEALKQATIRTFDMGTSANKNYNNWFGLRALELPSGFTQTGFYGKKFGPIGAYEDWSGPGKNEYRKQYWLNWSRKNQLLEANLLRHQEQAYQNSMFNLYQFGGNAYGSSPLPISPNALLMNDLLDIETTFKKWDHISNYVYRGLSSVSGLLPSLMKLGKTTVKPKKYKSNGFPDVDFGVPPY